MTSLKNDVLNKLKNLRIRKIRLAMNGIKMTHKDDDLNIYQLKIIFQISIINQNSN